MFGKTTWLRFRNFQSSTSNHLTNGYWLITIETGDGIYFFDTFDLNCILGSGFVSRKETI